MILLSWHNALIVLRGMVFSAKRKHKTGPPLSNPLFPIPLPITPGAISWLPLLTWIPMEQVPLWCGWLGLFGEKDDTVLEKGCEAWGLHCIAVNTDQIPSEATNMIVTVDVHPLSIQPLSYLFSTHGVGVGSAHSVKNESSVH